MGPMVASGHGPQGPDMGGVLMQGVNAWQGMNRADMEQARHAAMIEALKGNGMGTMWGSAPQMGAWGGAPAATQAMPMMQGFE